MTGTVLSCVPMRRVTLVTLRDKPFIGIIVHEIRDWQSHETKHPLIVYLCQHVLIDCQQLTT